MQISGNDITIRRRYARVAGLMYLFALATAVFGNFFVRSQMLDSAGPSVSAQNLIDGEVLFRVGLAVELAGLAAIVLLAVSLYTLVKPVDRTLSLLALLWWIGEAAILAVVLTLSFVALVLVNGDKYLIAFGQEHRDALIDLSLRVFYYAYDIGLVFFGLGSTVFSWLLFKGRYIPRLLSGFGIFASLSALIAVFVMTIAPGTTSALGIASVVPIFLYELLAGLWLSVLGAKISPDTTIPQS